MGLVYRGFGDEVGVESKDRLCSPEEMTSLVQKM